MEQCVPTLNRSATALWADTNCGQKNFELCFSDRLTFSNIPGRTSRRIYKVALQLHATEILTSLSKSRIFFYNAHLALFVQIDNTIIRTNISVRFVTFSKLEPASEVRAPLLSRHCLQTRQQTEFVAEWGRTWGACLRSGLPLVAITKMSKNNRGESLRVTNSNFFYTDSVSIW